MRLTVAKIMIKTKHKNHALVPVSVGRGRCDSLVEGGKWKPCEILCFPSSFQYEFRVVEKLFVLNCLEIEKPKTTFLLNRGVGPKNFVHTTGSSRNNNRMVFGFYSVA